MLTPNKDNILHYKILSKIGAGGMGGVYLAEDTKLNRQVALKILPAEFAEDRDRMSRIRESGRYRYPRLSGKAKRLKSLVEKAGSYHKVNLIIVVITENGCGLSLVQGFIRR
jgi:serine/threonine protein kinase